MKQYLISMYQPDEGKLEPEALERVMRDLEVVNEEIRAADGWVFGNGLHPPSTATVVRPTDNELLVTDGPFAEGKEHIGGLCIVRAPDLDVALDWGRKIARATGLPVEVWPFQGED